ncbi:MAG: bifunctional phosphoribosylaminoimidazolecarboxamide formyltransferase/IMP cyclohydrolase [Candidatus Marinimicrobia bacterium]|nr:bifunctional phosphoribosylaminoimidazolecarboxamide formyltransferase/IMP cyclohydrolase [Candidatus Neomarinimicrobiota bacterium]MCF7840040.1 bifunctional phosphoribosylaminoimidazolecarboxamide formyltransferase/IMP cyclohydrolase [Candidatus Neomarinimicrobiota bacterium]MCF7903043.1 bifunctional phosphoribosylaminoimidazolecarboxamide formyltransferase/IMP cyclohydrolase [Candidatus Neomarinimicrobiota bacterium]
MRVKRALVSVSDKTGIVELGSALANQNVEIISTGGTAKALKDAGIPITPINDVTGFPEIMDGRVKTLHPKIHGGILGLRDVHADTAEEQGIGWIDLVVCNLYPFAATIQRPDVTMDEALENIDIGGPSMIRSAAKNVGWVSVVVDPEDYVGVIQILEQGAGISFEMRQHLSAKAYAHTAAYDTVIANYFNPETFPAECSFTYKKSMDLRYGENPHQQAAVYELPIQTDGPNILTAKIHQGKKLSYNNIADADAALACLQEFEAPACVVVKHANPCGVAVGTDIVDVYQRAFNADSLSAFGGIIALNRTCSAAVAEEIRKVFVEIVLAPAYEPEALDILAKKKNLRVLELGEITRRAVGQEFKFVTGGLLVQDKDVHTLKAGDLKVVTNEKPDETTLQELLFAWQVTKHVKSNAILLAKDKTTVGIGAGQVSRVDATDIAVRKAGDRMQGAVLASDAFFPFRDSIDKLAGTGVKAIIQPGGSIRDEEVIQACNEHGIAMVFTGVRSFKHG